MLAMLLAVQKQSNGFAAEQALYFAVKRCVDTMLKEAKKAKEDCEDDEDVHDDQSDQGDNDEDSKAKAKADNL